MDRITAIAICEALLYELQPFDEQPKEAFQMALDALCEQEELGKELTNAVELIHKKNNRIDKLLKEQKVVVWCKDCKHFDPTINFCNNLETHNIYDDFSCIEGERFPDVRT